MKKILTLCMAVILGHVQPSLAQYTHEWTMFAGLTNYQGDLPEPHLEVMESRLAAGVFYRYHWHPRWAVRAHLIGGRISGDDAHAPSRSDRQFRFSAPIVESAVCLEWKPFGRRSLYYVGQFRPHWGPYVYVGAGMTHARPRPECYRADMAPGQDPFAGEMRQAWFLAIPIGVGIRLDATPHWSIGLEVGQRPVFSDLLDGISASANPEKDDWYVCSGLTVSWRMGTRSFRDVNGE